MDIFGLAVVFIYSRELTKRVLGVSDFIQFYKLLMNIHQLTDTFQKHLLLKRSHKTKGYMSQKD